MRTNAFKSELRRLLDKPAPQEVKGNMAFLYALIAALSATSAMAHLSGSENCGKPAIPAKLEAEDRIEGGVEVVSGSWPWHAEINSANNEHLCSGVLISDQYVLTAAKCLWKSKSKDIKVHLGSHTRNQNDQGEVWLKVEEACVYPNYTGSHENNIAIVKLEKKIQFTDRISPICLPKKNQPLPRTFYATGWGHSHAFHTHTHDHDHDHDHDHAHTHDHEDERAPRLRQAFIDITSNEGCYDEAGEGAPSTVFCTKYNKGAPCMHDLGGPISQKTGNVWTLFGIVSGGKEGEQYPALHTTVSLYLDTLINYFTHTASGSADPKRCLLV